MTWVEANNLYVRDFRCGFCSREVSSNYGYVTQEPFSSSWDMERVAYICPRCDNLTYFNHGDVSPRPPVGEEVAALPKEIAALYLEARRAAQAGAPTASVLICRKILMHVGVEQGADEGLSFARYVQHLADTGYVPPNGRRWVDHIRTRGNEANHEINLMSPEQAAELVLFVGMLLKFIYEMPSLVPDMDDPPDAA